MLDIGGEVGALVVYLAERPPTGEPEPARWVTRGPVPHRRPPPFHPERLDLDGGLPEVTEGRYLQLLDDCGVPMADVTVTGGNVHSSTCAEQAETSHEGSTYVVAPRPGAGG